MSAGEERLQTEVAVALLRVTAPYADLRNSGGRPRCYDGRHHWGNHARSFDLSLEDSLMPYRLFCVALVLGLAAAGCDDSTTSPSATTAPRFTAILSPTNEVPAIINADASGTGTVSVTFNTTQTGAGNITAATADFVVTLSGFPANTTLTGAHIHQAPAGTNGSIVVNTGLLSGEVVLTSNGAGTFTKSGITVDPALAQTIINGPAGFYFNVHTTLNGGGAARGQLARAN
jgi:CHRD domain